MVVLSAGSSVSNCAPIATIIELSSVFDVAAVVAVVELLLHPTREAAINPTINERRFFFIKIPPSPI
jgi:hypothetical protein